MVLCTKNFAPRCICFMKVHVSIYIANLQQMLQNPYERIKQAPLNICCNSREHYESSYHVRLLQFAMLVRNIVNIAWSTAIRHTGITRGFVFSAKMQYNQQKSAVPPPSPFLTPPKLQPVEKVMGDHQEIMLPCSES